jgi:hypothetical protein
MAALEDLVQDLLDRTAPPDEPLPGIETAPVFAVLGLLWRAHGLLRSLLTLRRTGAEELGGELISRSVFEHAVTGSGCSTGSTTTGGSSSRPATGSCASSPRAIPVSGCYSRRPGSDGRKATGPSRCSTARSILRRSCRPNGTSTNAMSTACTP